MYGAKRGKEKTQFKSSKIKKSILLLLVMAVGFCYVACGNNQNMDQSRESQIASPAEEKASNTETNYSEDAKGASATDEPEVNLQKLIKTGNINMEVEDIKSSYEKLSAIAKKYKGYIFSMNEYDDGYTKTTNITVKADSKNFEAVMKELESIGKVKNSSMNTQDVTREYIDTQARIDTLKIQENTLKELMKKAQKVEDLLKIETELQRIRQDIESTQGQLNYLKDAVSYSTIDVLLQQKGLPTAAEKGSALEKFLFSLKDGFGFWTNALLNIIAAIIWLLPLILIFLAGAFIFKKPLKKWIDHRRQTNNKKL